MSIISDIISPSVLITVGSTNFDELITNLDNQYETFIPYLIQNGYKTLIIQYGRGEKKPENITKHMEQFQDLKVLSMDFSNEFPDILDTCSLVISHAGAGSILETLSKNNPPKLLVVVNNSLMDNHQLELAEHMANLNYLYFSYPNNTVEQLIKADWSKIKPYPKPNSRIAQHILKQHIN